MADPRYAAPGSDDDDDDDIPILTDIVDVGPDEPRPSLDPDDIEGLKTALLAEIHDLADTLVRASSRELEAMLHERIANGLKRELPGLVERILREHVESLRTRD